MHINGFTLGELAKVGVTASDVESNVGAMSWSELHETRKRLRKATASLPEGANGALAMNAIGERIAELSDEADEREANGEREPNATRQAASRREQETGPRTQALAAAREAFKNGRPAVGGSGRNNDWRPGQDLVLGRDDSAISAYGAPKHNFGDVFRAALLGDHSRLSPEASQNMTSGAAGGFLIQDQLWGSVLDLARNKMRTREAGITVIDQSRSVVGGTSFPTVESDPTPHWRGELMDITESGATFGERNFQARTVAIYVTGSIESLEDTALLGPMVADTIAAQIAQQADYACLAGNGTGQPLGVLNMEGVQSVDAHGALTDYSPFALAVQRVREQNVEPGAFILSPSTMGHVDALKDTTGQPLQPPPSLAKRAFLDTNAISRTGESPITASAVVGEWSSLYCIFRQGLVLEVSRTSGDSFKKLGWAARGYARLDAFPVRPSRFCKVINLPAN